MKNMMLAGCCLIALTLAQRASAQQVEGPTAGAAPQAPQDGLQDIVITAQKRTESAQRTPAAVTAYNGSQLVQTGVTDLRGVQAVVPAARFQQEGQSTQVFLRGIGASLDFVNIDQSVAFNFNGVYIPREGTSVPLFDVERLEVLPGPQGTLYGRSALGGTINVSFRQPTREWETSGVAEIGNYNLGHISLAQNVPIAPDLAIRVAGDYTYRKGYMETGADSRNDLAGRIGVLYDPTPDLKVYLWAYGVRKHGYSPGLVNKGLDPDTGAYSENAFLRDRPWDDLRVGAFADPALLPFGQPRRERIYYKNWVAGGQIDIGLGNDVTLTYIPSYLYLASRYGYWLGVVPASNDIKYKQVTQELRLSGKSSKLQWLVGLYGFRQSDQQSLLFAPDTPAQGIFGDIDRDVVKGLGLFGQATYSLLPALRFTIGGRYSVTNRQGEGTASTNEPYSFERTFRRFDYKVGVEYDVAPAVMAYLTYQTGYQPGTYNLLPATPSTDNLIKPARLSSITGGLKARFLDNKVQINNEAFYYVYNDLIIQSFDASKLYNPAFNAKKVVIYGDQLDITVRPTTDDLLSLNIAYLNARNKDFVTPTGENYNGLSPSYASPWTVSGRYSHDFQLTAGYIQAQVDARYEGAFYADFIHHPGTRQQPAIKENASITYYDGSGRWNVGAWIMNISNRAVIAATAFAGIPGPATAYLEAPRTFGVRVGFKF